MNLTDLVPFLGTEGGSKQSATTQRARAHSSLLLLAALVWGIGCSTPPTTDSKPAHQQEAPTIPLATYQAKPGSVAPALPREQFITRLSFASCSDQKAEQKIWSDVLRLKPQLHLALGDNVYGSNPQDKPLSKAYNLQARIPEFAKFRAAVPMLAAWDDHDTGKNDSGEENPFLGEARIEFLKFFPWSARLLRNQKNGTYHSVILGPPGRRLQIIVLDTRSFRSPLLPAKNPQPLKRYDEDSDTTKTVLGKTQWNWLAQELKRPAELRLVLSSIQLLANQHGFERWGNFPLERQRLIDLLSTPQIAGQVVVLSGDRHVGELSGLRLSSGRMLVDATASSVNRPSSLRDEVNDLRLGSRIPQVNYGWMEIDWSQQHAKLELRDANGAASTTEIKFGRALSPGSP
jgi:alkaline phosphatase D